MSIDIWEWMLLHNFRACISLKIFKKEFCELGFIYDSNGSVRLYELVLAHRRPPSSSVCANIRFPSTQFVFFTFHPLQSNIKLPTLTSCDKHLLLLPPQTMTWLAITHTVDRCTSERCDRGVFAWNTRAQTEVAWHSLRRKIECSVLSALYSLHTLYRPTVTLKLLSTCTQTWISFMNEFRRELIWMTETQWNRMSHNHLLSART